MEIEVHDIIHGTNECVVLRVVEDTNLWRYMMFPSGPSPQESPNNSNRHSFFFNSNNVKAGDFIIVYSGVGRFRSYKNKGGSTTYEYYWGLNKKLWPNDVNYVLICNISETARYKK